MPLFNGMPNYRDIHQGSIGSCWYLSALAVYLHCVHGSEKRVASWITEVVVEHRPLYRIKFHDVIYYVDAYFPVEYRGCSMKVLWPLLMEKAMMCHLTPSHLVFRDGYICPNIDQTMDYSNTGALGLLYVTGKSSQYYNLHTEPHIRRRLERTLYAGSLMAANTSASTFQSDPCAVQMYQAVGRHCYGIFKISDHEITLYNPWGCGGMTDQIKSVERGVFTISWELFIKVFAFVHVTGTLQP